MGRLGLCIERCLRRICELHTEAMIDNADSLDSQ